MMERRQAAATVVVERRQEVEKSRIGKVLAGTIKCLECASGVVLTMPGVTSLCV
jgi:hypothetical protein